MRLSRLPRGFFHFIEKEKTTTCPHHVLMALISHGNLFRKYLVFLFVLKNQLLSDLFEKAYHLSNKATQILIKDIIKDYFNW